MHCYPWDPVILHPWAPFLSTEWMTVCAIQSPAHWNYFLLYCLSRTPLCEACSAATVYFWLAHTYWAYPLINKFWLFFLLQLDKRSSPGSCRWAEEETLVQNWGVTRCLGHLFMWLPSACGPVTNPKCSTSVSWWITAGLVWPSNSVDLIESSSRWAALAVWSTWWCVVRRSNLVANQSCILRSVSCLARDDRALLQNPRGLDGDSPTRPCHKLHRHLSPLELPQIPWVLPDHMVHRAKVLVLQPGPAAESRSKLWVLI